MTGRVQKYLGLQPQTTFLRYKAENTDQMDGLRGGLGTLASQGLALFACTEKAADATKC